MYVSAQLFLAHDLNHDDQSPHATLVTMNTSLRRCSRHALFATTLISLLGCGHTSTSSAPQAEPASIGKEPPAAVAPPPPPTAGTGAAAITSVDVFYNAMTYVMDIPTNQQSKAEEAVKASDLVKQLVSMGLTVNVIFDAAVRDDVVVKAKDGTELGRADLHDIDGQRAPAAMLDKISAAIAARK